MQEEGNIDKNKTKEKKRGSLMKRRVRIVIPSHTYIHCSIFTTIPYVNFLCVVFFLHIHFKALFLYLREISLENL